MFRGQIDEKLKEIVDYVIDKPVGKITLDDYTILRDVRTMESESDSRERMERLMAAATTGFGRA